MAYILQIHRAHQQTQGTFGVKKEESKVFLIVKCVEVMKPEHDPAMDPKFMVHMLQYHRVYKRSQRTFAVWTPWGSQWTAT